MSDRPFPVTTLFQEVSPYGSLAALVEDDGRTVYLYLSGPEGSDTPSRFVWLMNKVPAPEGGEVELTTDGRAPLMPAEGTLCPDGSPAPAPESLSVVWFPGGEGVMLLEGDQVLGILELKNNEPIAGISAQAVQTEGSCATLGHSMRALGEEVAREILETVRGFWTWRLSPESWEETWNSIIPAVEAAFGPRVQFWNADRDMFPPIGVAQLKEDKLSRAFFSSVGMSAQPQPDVTPQSAGDAPPTQVELVLAVEDDPEWAPGLVALLARYPWSYFRSFAADDLVEIRLTGIVPQGEIAGVLVTADPPPDARLGAPPFPVPEADGAELPIQWLWILPVSPSELAFGQAYGVFALKRRLTREGRSWLWNP